MKMLINKIARKFGIELRKFNPTSSDLARLGTLLVYHKIDLVLDVGANTGQYAKSLREAGYSGRIISFEPLSSVYDKLKLASKKDSLWEVAQRAAIGDKDGDISINIANNTQSSSVLPMLESHLQAAPESEYVDSETVKLYRLDTIATQYIDDRYESIYLKIDVQGYELQVLEGSTLLLPRIKGIQLELSLVPLYEGEPVFRDMLDKLDQLEYELHAVIPGFTDTNSGRLLQLDGIFFRK